MLERRPKHDGSRPWQSFLTLTMSVHRSVGGLVFFTKREKKTKRPVDIEILIWQPGHVRTKMACWKQQKKDSLTVTCLCGRDDV